MKILVAMSAYSKPSQQNSHFFVQVRNLYYKEKGIDVFVLNFASKEDYLIDDIPVLSPSSIKEKLKKEKFDLLICHQANIRNHFFFLLNYHKYFFRIVFFFHGHEVLNCRKVYSTPYPYLRKKSWYSIWGQEIYDTIKLSIWHYYYPKLLEKSHFIFVSQWMCDQFVKWTQISPKLLQNHASIIYNGVGEIFEKERYNESNLKKYDFITIRGNLDGSKYCIDLVNTLAKANPQFKFLVIGRGVFFDYNEKAQNLEWKDVHLSHLEMIKYLNHSRCALMPTRTDAQGLMMCEMATFGIPLITSNIPVCHEVLGEFANVRLIQNDALDFQLNPLLDSLEQGLPYLFNSKYSQENTIEREVQLFQKLLRN